MSHSICKDSEGIFYCTKCGAQNEDSRSELCKAAIHEEKLKSEIEMKKLEYYGKEEKLKREIEMKKLGTQRLFYLLAIFVQIGIFVLLFKGFDSIAQAVNGIMVGVQKVFSECSRGGWARLVKSLFNNQ